MKLLNSKRIIQRINNIHLNNNNNNNIIKLSSYSYSSLSSNIKYQINLNQINKFSSSFCSYSSSKDLEIKKSVSNFFKLVLYGGGLFLLGYYYEELNSNLPKIKKLNSLSQDKLKIDELDETLTNYKNVISNSKSNQFEVQKMKDGIETLNSLFSSLKLTSEQLTIIQTAEDIYKKENKKIADDIYRITNSFEIIKNARNSNNDNNHDNGDNNPSTQRRINELESLLKTKFQIETTYINKVINTLTIEQYTSLINELQKCGKNNSLSPWIGLLNNSPISIPSLTQRNVFVLNFRGDIKASQVSKLRNEITAIIENANESDEVVVVLNSRGGEVSAYGLAAIQLERIKSSGLKLTVCVDEVAASGGYLMACVGDRLVASPFASIGSIGVIATVPNIYERLKREGVQVDEILAGKSKRNLTPFKKVTESDKLNLQDNVNNIHNIFKDFVKKYRPNLDIDDVATGQVWLGYDALKKGLCDELKSSDDVLLDMKKTGAKVFFVSTPPKRKTVLDRFYPSDDNTEFSDINISQLYLLFHQFLKILYSTNSQNSSSSTSSSSLPNNLNEPTLSYNQNVMISEYESEK